MKDLLLFDGAMGTLLQSRLPHHEGPTEFLNLTHPQEIQKIHQEYIEAGAKAIKTNTFGLPALVDDYESNKLLETADAALTLAKEAANDKVQIYGDLGPGDIEAWKLFASFFLEKGITHFLLETLSSTEGVLELAKWLKAQNKETRLIVSFAIDADGTHESGYSAQQLYDLCNDCENIDAAGFNCIISPYHMKQVVSKLQIKDIPLSIMPNAGYPVVLGRKVHFQGTPDFFAEQMYEIACYGASVLGGCCGTTPDSIAHLARILKEKPVQKIQKKAACVQGEKLEAKSALDLKFEGQDKIIAVELDPPADDNLASFVKGVKELQEKHIDLLTIADCPIGRPRADSSLLASKMKQELGVEPLPHMTCRDRNLNATKALLLGLSMNDVHNVLVVTGDPLPSESKDIVKSVFNFNSRKLARFISELNETSLSKPFRIYGALNINAPNFQSQLNMAKEKEECGISVFLTQPVLSKRGYENLKLAHQELKGKILGGIFPIVSYKNAQFLQNQVSGMDLDPALIESFKDMEREQAEAHSLKISSQIAKAIEEYVDGYYIMTPFKRTGLVARIIDEIKLQ
jgi:homocysteine S-methyltransferase